MAEKTEPVLADFHPGTSHKHECPKTRVSSGADCTSHCIHDLYAVAAAMDRELRKPKIGWKR